MPDMYPTSVEPVSPRPILERAMLRQGARLALDAGRQTGTRTGDQDMVYSLEHPPPPPSGPTTRQQLHVSETRGLLPTVFAGYGSLALSPVSTVSSMKDS